MRRVNVLHGTETIQLHSWNEFYNLVARDFQSAPAFVFRGQADASWKVESSLDRWERLHSSRRSPREEPNATSDGGEARRNGPPVSREVHLRAFRQAIRAMSPVELPKEDDTLTWALAQHHGLRTPLLDWSLSPFVALFFAFEHELVHDHGKQHDKLVEPAKRAVFALSTTAIAQTLDNGQSRGKFRRVYSPSGPVSQRLLAQSSLFLMMPENTDLETFIADHLADLSAADKAGGSPVLKRIEMPNRDRRECLKMLNKMNINRLTLFPDLEGAARYINGLWDLDFDSALGPFEDADYAAQPQCAQDQ